MDVSKMKSEGLAMTFTVSADLFIQNMVVDPEH